MTVARERLRAPRLEIGAERGGFGWRRLPPVRLTWLQGGLHEGLEGST